MEGPTCPEQQLLPQGVPKGGNPVMATNTVTTRKKGDPQVYVEGKKTCLMGARTASEPLVEGTVPPCVELRLFVQP